MNNEERILLKSVQTKSGTLSMFCLNGNEFQIDKEKPDGTVMTVSQTNAKHIADQRFEEYLNKMNGEKK